MAHRVPLFGRHALAGIALAALGAAPAAPAPRPAPAAGLVGHWSFAGCDGKVAKDRSPQRNDGAIEYGVVRAEKAGASLELEGLGSGITIPLRAPLPVQDALTTLIWVKPFELRNNTVLFGIPHATPGWTTPVFGMYVSDRRVVSGMWLEGGSKKVLVESPGALPRNAWSCLAATYDGRAARLYVDGAVAAEQPAEGGVAFNGQPLLVGTGLGGKPSLRGRVGELRVYSRALSAAEVKALYEQTKGGYDLARPAARVSRDRTVAVETHGNTPESARPWVPRPTRLLEGLEGFRPTGGTTPVDEYGGRTDRPAQQATGFFRVIRVGGRHWLVDPEGRLFYHVGINTVREPRNVAALFGSAEGWAKAATEQLRGAGFNGLGNGESSRLRQVPRPLVWVRRQNFMFAFAREKGLVEPAAGTQGFPGRIMPVFHPEFEAFCDRYGRGLADVAQDRRLLGIMTDNELQCPSDLLDRCLAIDPANADLKPNRDAAEAWLAAHREPGRTGAPTQRERYQFIAYAFERYYRIVRAAIRKYDPNHLYLGSRINYHGGQFDNPWFWKALAPYHDVVSVNYYGQWGPDREQLAEWEEWSGKPVLFTEWYAKAMDVPGLANTKGAGWLVRTQEDRARYYQHFVLGALEIPSVVGFHWFKYLDDPAESTALDSVGGANKGMFDVQGRPYAPLFERARAINREVYPLIDFFDRRSAGPDGAR